MLLPKTRSTIKNEIIPMIANVLPSLRPSKKESKDVVVSMDIKDIQNIVQDIMEKDKQYSGAFDYYHQSGPASITPNVLEKLYGRDLNFLRQYYLMCSPIDQLIFQKRFEQLRAISDCVEDDPKKIGWRVVHRKKDSQDFRTNKDIERNCRWFEQLIKSPNKLRHPGGFPEALVAIAESKMLFDRVPIEKCEHVDYPGHGLPSSYLIPDAATIKPTAWVLHAMAGQPGYSGKTDAQQAKAIVYDSQQTANSIIPQNMEYAAMEVAKQISKRSKYDEREEYERLRSGVIQWVQQMPDRLVAAGYTDKNINVFIANHSPQVNTWGWSSGSAFERSFEFGEVICKMTGYNKEIFDSRMPEGLLTIVNAGVDKRGKQQMHERMNDEGADRYSNLLVQYVNDPDKDIKYTPLKNKPTDMQFQQMFTLYIKLKCSAYGFDYTELNIEDGKSGGLGGSGAHEKRMEQQSAAGIRSDSRYYAHLLTEALIKPWSADYRMEFVHDITETQEEVELRTKKMAYKSLFETRIEENLEDDWWKSAPKEFREKLKEYGQFSYIPGVTDAGRVQLIQKLMEQDLQKEMAEQEQQAEEEAPEEEGEPQESKEISDLKTAIGQEEKATKELEKSFAVTVNHEY